MVKSQGVEVYIRRFDDKQRYQEYDAPKASEDASQQSAEAYVEAVTGERFAVVIVITPEFDFKGSPDVRMSWSLDKSSQNLDYSAMRVQSAISAQGSCKVVRKTTHAFVNGQWQSCRLSYTDLQLGRISHVCYGNLKTSY